MAAALLCALTAPGPAASQDSSPHPSLPWVNQVLLTEKLRPALDSFFGGARGHYDIPLPGHGDPSLLGTQFKSAFFGVPVEDAPISMADGRKLYLGCKPHECEIKAALITEADGTTPVVAALLHFTCRRKGPVTEAREGAEDARGCQRIHALTVFFPNRLSVNLGQRKALVSWTTTTLEKEAASAPPALKPQYVLRVETVLLSKQGAAASGSAVLTVDEPVRHSRAKGAHHAPPCSVPHLRPGFPRPRARESQFTPR